MRKIFKFITVISLYLTLILQCFTLTIFASNGNTVYVDANANDGVNGSKISPFKTIDEARLYVRSFCPKIGIGRGSTTNTVNHVFDYLSCFGSYRFYKNELIRQYKNDLI